MPCSRCMHAHSAVLLDAARSELRAGNRAAPVGTLHRSMSGKRFIRRPRRGQQRLTPSPSQSLSGQISRKGNRIMHFLKQATSMGPCTKIGGRAVLVLEDGTVLHGKGLGSFGQTLGEVCFNTSMTGYQEILTDPSYAGQIITFTFPHIGNVGTNDEDIESRRPACRGLVLREDITPPANWRTQVSLDQWLRERNLIGIAGVDTRRLAGRIRDKGAPKGCLAFAPAGRYDVAHLQAVAAQ